MNKSSAREEFLTYILHIIFIYSISHMLNSYIVYSHLGRVSFLSFSSGKELGELEFKIMI